MLIGAPKNLLDPRIHHSLALIAFFAWVGLGSDGLSSSSYGPEEAFLQLGAHRHLALYLMMAMVVTIFLISASYSQIIELFPSGGGGYLVASKLLGPYPGILSGSALLVDYILTIAISVASGVDAIYSFLPPEWQPFKLFSELIMVTALTTLNMRGVKESVVVLTPIFLGFMVSHITLVLFGIFTHTSAFPHLLTDTVSDTRGAITDLGWLGVIIVFLKAYSLGGGTFTGIEAVSNSTDILREPRVETGRKTMTYMAISLAFMAGGILLCYLLNDVQHEQGKTLNASLWMALVAHWQPGGLPIGDVIVWFTLITEGALLFVAAQTGFVAGPRTLGAMAADQWVPKRFAHLSERLVTQNGIISMGVAAGLVLIYTGGAVKILVVMYSINVFMTFTLTQLGMMRHWWMTRKVQQHWRRRLTIATTGTLLTAMILVVTSVVKFLQGGWVTLAVTGALLGFCVVVRRHYQGVRQMLSSLDDVLTNLPLPEVTESPELAPDGPTAIVLVESYAGLGIHTLLSIQRLFPRHFKNFVFVSVGLVDSGQFKGVQDLEALENKVRGGLEQYVDLATRLGYYSEYRYTLGTDLIAELEDICLDLIKEFRRPVVFAGQLVFQRENLFTRSLHHETAYSIQRRLQFRGVQVIILPIRVWETKRAA
ncbi:MAG: APC family permease [Candidatus Eisenbacteria bacterium]|uniref:APC family permease n=1 Tax=Eiseniibacteriota bacterium TaxID=2212470 RepID=A0A849SLR0_UNCEI|nr:APC family permease [Candidatus Eisenbacteria bacterium]